MVRKYDTTLKKSPIIWVLVADGSQSQVYVRCKREKHLPLAGNSKHPHYEESEVWELMPVEKMLWHAASTDTYELGRDRLGRVVESVGSARHMSQPHIEVKEEVKLQLAKTIAEHINKAHASKAFDRLILVAPPRMLGYLRDQLDKKVMKAVIAELVKDITHFDTKSVAGMIDGVVTRS